MNKNLLITIITVVKNDERHIAQSIKSIIDQKDPHIEYIVIDGVSTDNTKNIIKKYIDNIDKFISEPDQNLYDAINKGIKMATGDIIGVCNSGDYYKPNAFKIVRKYFEINNNLDFLFGTIIRNYTGSTVLKNGFYPKRILYNFDAQTSISTGFFITSKAQKIVGEYDLNFPVSSDYDFFFRLMIKHRLIGISSKKDEITGEMSAGGLSSKITYIAHLKEESKIRLKNKQNVLLIFVIIINGVFKNFKRIYSELKKMILS
tara:strand:- start:272 stop:1051 length:780 start_codon:yes stop_codon:yes gene_type:complete